nr:uncharacterized protein LOC125630313 [Caretta caretta]
MDSCKGGVSRNRDEDFGDEEDSAHQASGETVLHYSQELSPWIQYPPNPGSWTLKVGEGSSAANVSTLRLASPSQRLVQIRRQKNRAHDEMFSELMQSTQTERTQQNAWRQTIAESRKPQNEHKDRRLEQQERWQQRDKRRQDAMLRLLEDKTDMLRRKVKVQERRRPPLRPLCNKPLSSPSSIASSPRRPRTSGGSTPGTHPLHPRGLPKQQKADIQ